MDNILVIDRDRFKVRSMPNESDITAMHYFCPYLMLLDFVSINEEDGTYTIIKNRVDGETGNVSEKSHFNYLMKLSNMEKSSKNQGFYKMTTDENLVLDIRQPSSHMIEENKPATFEHPEYKLGGLFF